MNPNHKIGLNWAELFVCILYSIILIGAVSYSAEQISTSSSFKEIAFYSVLVLFFASRIGNVINSVGIDFRGKCFFKKGAINTKQKIKTAIKTGFKVMICILYVVISLRTTFFLTGISIISFLQLLIEYELIAGFSSFSLKFFIIEITVGAFAMCYVSQLYLIDKLFKKKKK